MGSKWRHALVLSAILSATLLLAPAAATAQGLSSPLVYGASQILTPTPGEAATPTPTIPLLPAETPTITPPPQLTPAVTLQIPRFPPLSGQQQTPTPGMTPTPGAEPTPGTPTATPPTLVSPTPDTPTAPPPGIDTPTPSPPAQPTPGLQPTPGAAPEPGGPLSGEYESDLVRGLQQFDSYQMHSLVRWALEDGGQGHVEITSAVQNRPPAQYWNITIAEVDGVSRNVEIVRRGTRNYVRVGNAWQPLPASGELLLRRVRWVTRPDELIDLTQGRFVGVRTVNGFRSEYYRYRTEAFEPAQRHVSIRTAQADLYVSRRYDVITRMRIRGLGEDALGNAGRFDLVMNLVRVNHDVEIPDPTVVEDGEADAALVLPAALNLEMLDSFRVLGTVDAAVGLAPRGLAVIEARVSDDPPAEHLSIDLTTSLLGLRQRVEYLNVDGVAYLQQAGQWRVTEGFPRQLLDQFAWVSRPATFLRIEEGELVEEGTLRGLDVQRYHYDLEAFSEVTLLERIDEASADLWLATEHGIYTRIEVSLRGRDAEGRPAVYNIDVNVLDVNERVEIERPANLPEPTPQP